MWTMEDRSGNYHRIRTDRISAYYLLSKTPHSATDPNWCMSIILFGCDKEYGIEFANKDAAMRALVELDNCFGI